MPTLNFKIKRTTVFATQIQSGASGIEQRASFNALPRYKYEISITARQYEGNDEVAYINNLWEMHYGQYDSFRIIDPMSGELVIVRFDMDELAWSRKDHHLWWQVDISLISVKGVDNAYGPWANSPNVI